MGEEVKTAAFNSIQQAAMSRSIVSYPYLSSISSEWFFDHLCIFDYASILILLGTLSPSICTTSRTATIKSRASTAPNAIA
jgi:hypothetical protein